MRALAWLPVLAIGIACLGAVGCASDDPDLGGDDADPGDESDTGDEDEGDDDDEVTAMRDGGSGRDSGAAGRDGGTRDAAVVEGGARDGGGLDGGQVPAPDGSVPGRTDGGIGSGDGGMQAAPDASAPGMVAIDPPMPDDCITDVEPGDHRFNCGDGVDYLVMVDERCTQFSCGVIFDVHGAVMDGEIMRANTHLHELAPREGYLVVHPSAPSGAWDLAADPPKMAEFMERMIEVFHADPGRVHITGFSMGSAVTFWFLCNRPELLASTAPVTGQSAEQVRAIATGGSCVESIDADWQPRVPILFMSGSLDSALPIEQAQARTDGIVMRLGLTGGEEIDGDQTFRRRRWEGADGMVLDFLEHDYSNLLIAGHCIPGGDQTVANYIACTDGGDSLDWGETVLQWFLEHPKR